MMKNFIKGNPSKPTDIQYSVPHRGHVYSTKLSQSLLTNLLFYHSKKPPQLKGG